MDEATAQWKAGARRDDSMATNVMARANVDPTETVLVLVGSVHAAKTKGLGIEQSFESMTHRILQSVPTTVIGFEAEAGTAWTCRKPADELVCGPAARARGKLFSGDVDWAVRLDPLTASAPAIGAR